jgi:imidazolonepropionase-like amidohydrolase
MEDGLWVHTAVHRLHKLAEFQVKTGGSIVQMKTIIKSDLLIDGTGAKPIKQGIVGIEGEKISFVGPPDHCDTFSGDGVIDLSGETVMPGLVDGHSHLTLSGHLRNYVKLQQQPDLLMILRASKNMKLDLKSGVTTLRCMGEKGGIDFILKEAIEGGMCLGPRLLISGCGIRTTFGHGVMGLPFDGPDQVRQAVRRNLHAGADQIKIFVNGSEGEFRMFDFGSSIREETDPSWCLMSKEEINAAVEEAHNVGKRVGAHCYGGGGLGYCLQCGVDNIEHGIYVSEKDLEFMKKAGTWLTLTFNDFFNDERLFNRGTPELTERFKKTRPTIRKSLEMAVASGVNYCLGTDGQHGSLWSEMAFLAQFGGNAMDAIIAATKKAAMAAGVSDRVGTLEVGKLADIISVKGNPLEDIRVMKEVGMVMQGGERINFHAVD